ncbi:uncharacterized protein LOC132754389 [Ruditapes philippinarum]|uniref:uncharacterized protein LOC132754389 n=1 Tax=Ruditapes philippinarum TaxID=129788 RepID=UPI00295A8CEE|nr:uncharacterized protein LOC132754389 [Ruditapes philippinarum]
MHLAVSTCLLILTICTCGINASNEQIFAPAIPSTGGGNGGFGPGGSLADMYCAYCRQRGWTDCIRRYCFGGFGAFGIVNQAGFISSFQPQERFIFNDDPKFYLRLKYLYDN